MVVTPQIAALILLLVPGLLGHALFCAFSYTAKPSWSGRTVIALILSSLSYLIISFLRPLTIYDATLFHWLPNPTPMVNALNSGVNGVITANSLACVGAACVISVVLSLGLVRAHNARLGHKLARFTGMTTKSGFESEWDSVMIQLARKRWVMLLMNDGSAYTGWLESHDIASDQRAVVLSKVREYDSDDNHFMWPSSELLFIPRLDNVRAIRLIPAEEIHHDARTPEESTAPQTGHQISKPKPHASSQDSAPCIADQTEAAITEGKIAESIVC